MVLAAYCDALVVQHLGQGQFTRHPGERFLRLRIRTKVEQRKPTVKSGFQGIRIVGAHLGEGRSCFFILLSVEILAAERHPRRTVIRAQGNGLLQMPLALLLIWLRDSTNVLFEGIQPQTGAGSKKRVLRHVESGIHDPREPPRERIEHGDKVVHLTPRHYSVAHPQVRYVQHARLGHNTRTLHPIAAHNDGVDVERLRQF